MESATTRVSSEMMSLGSTLFWVANENSTKANSPPCASARAKVQRWLGEMRMTRPSTIRTPHFKTIRPTTRDGMSRGWAANRPKSMPAPTDMKNRPSSSPLNGSMSASSSWRYSLSASTTPARKEPRAGESPTDSISTAMAITSSKAAATKISRMWD
ncbi:hypothetical protein D3C76_1227570 [compost metagenome]